MREGLGSKLSDRTNAICLGDVLHYLPTNRTGNSHQFGTKPQFVHHNAFLPRAAEVRAMTTSASTGSPIRTIELAGLPGTGKSTVARCLESILRDAGMPIRPHPVTLGNQSWFMRRQQARLQLIVRNTARCGLLYRRVFGLIAGSGQRSVVDFAVVLSNFWSIIALMTEGQAASNGLTIADQGILQAIWSVQLSSSKELPLDEWTPLLLAAGLRGALLVHIQSDIAVSRHRVATRLSNQTRLGLGSFQERSQEWQIAAKNMDRLMEWARTAVPHDELGARVLSVVNREGAPEAAAAEIASAYFSRTALKPAHDRLASRGADI